MTREDAIKILKDSKAKISPHDLSFHLIEHEKNEALEMAIKALEQEPVLDNTIIIPKGATNGDMIKAVFPDALKSNYIESVLDMKDYVTIYIGDYEMRVAYDWWDAPYKAESEDKDGKETRYSK